jgi:hypothetical protein
VPALTTAYAVPERRLEMEPKNPKQTVRIQLTDEQKKQLLEETGQQIEAVVFNVEQLEDRITPKSIGRFF